MLGGVETVGGGVDAKGTAMALTSAGGVVLSLVSGRLRHGMPGTYGGG